MSDNMENWPEHERRREIHVTCAKESDWGELKAVLKSIRDAQERIEDQNKRIFLEIFGNGHDGLKIIADRTAHGLKRAWWWLGIDSAAIVVATINHLLK